MEDGIAPQSIMGQTTEDGIGPQTLDGKGP
jgi:hypothetical protein